MVGTGVSGGKPTSVTRCICTDVMPCVAIGMLVAKGIGVAVAVWVAMGKLVGAATCKTKDVVGGMVWIPGSGVTVGTGVPTGKPS